jgi:hypothetical protein
VTDATGVGSRTDIARAELLQHPEESVAVPRDRAVSASARCGRVLDVADGAIENRVVRALEDCDFQAELRDAKNAERGRRRLLHRREPRRDPFGRPEMLIRRSSRQPQLRELLHGGAPSGFLHCAVRYPCAETRDADGPQQQFDEKPRTSMRTLRHVVLSLVPSRDVNNCHE